MPPPELDERIQSLLSAGLFFSPFQPKIRHCALFRHATHAFLSAGSNYRRVRLLGANSHPSIHWTIGASVSIHRRCSARGAVYPSSALRPATAPSGVYQSTGGQVPSSVLRHAPTLHQLVPPAAAAADSRGRRGRGLAARRPPPQLFGGRLLAQTQPAQGRPLPGRPAGEAHLGGQL